MNNIKAAIFDLDGTLVDSMWVWKQIDIDYLSKKGHSVPKNLNDEITHLSFSQTAEYFKNKFSLEDSIEEIMNDWNTMAYNYYTNDIKLKPGGLQYLLKLKELGIKIGLATSNSYPLLEAVLKKRDIYNLFDAIVTTEEAKKSKSNPDVYLMAATRLDVKPSECIVFEDIIEAANIRLEKMTGDRFSLIRKTSKSKGAGQKGLELEIYDNYTATSRDVSSLSGGESFKASLSLALGLSDVVQSSAGGVSLETMFVDEGFGTLDPQSLDSAIDSLLELQKGGRLVGIISHVQELKDRVDAKIEVISTKRGSMAEFNIL